MKERFEMIKKDLIESRRVLVDEGDYVRSDSILMKLFDDGHLHWLVEEFEKLQKDVELYKLQEQMHIARLKKSENKPPYADIDD